ncbi:MAG: cupin domain-containing protein [Bacteroidales bacterium]|nr:cupin domain-containing protein [Bacteroidales bacterium]
MRTARWWIDRLKLMPHPEGGYYKEVYRSAAQFPYVDSKASFPAGRAVSTAIYYLLETGDFSAFHRIKSDEIWHFYAGDTLEILEFDDSAKLHIHPLCNAEDDGTPVVVIPANHWFAARLTPESRYVLAGCTVAPGFDFRDFTMGNKQDLLTCIPEYADIIAALTR